MAKSSSGSEYPMSPLCKRWWELLRVAAKHKEEVFGKDAKEMMHFFTCGKEAHEAMWTQRHKTEKQMLDDEQSMPAPFFKVVVGKVAEGVELFGPTLYHRNPDIVVEPKTCEIPNEMLFPLIPPEVVQQAQMMAQQSGQPFDMNSLIPPDPDENKNKLVAKLMQYYLNYIQRENDKKTQSRRAIDEAIIKGMSVLWTEAFEMYPGGPTLIGSFYDTVDNLLIDPDAETIDECWWVARKRLQPLWYVAQKFKLSEKYLREKYATHESAQAEADAARRAKDQDQTVRNGQTNDLIEYWEVYSKMGFGATRLKSTPNEEDRSEDEAAVDEVLQTFGDNVYFAVAEKIPFPLNFHTKDLEELQTEPDQEVLDQMHEEKLNQVQWPVPFWSDGQWPFTPFVFHEVPNSAWPMSHFKPGLCHLKVINWLISFLVNRCRHSSRTLLGAWAALDDEIKDKILSGKDFEIIEMKQGMGAGNDINKLVSFLQMPNVQTDMWKIVEAEFDLFNKATGLEEIMYGSAGGMRSATEAQLKGSKANTRVDDMAQKVEDAMSLVARKEAMAARWLLERDSIMPVLGQRCTDLWEQMVATKDLQSVAREYNYRVEAGTARKPDKDTQANNAQQLIQVVPPLLQLGANPQFTDIVNKLLSTWAEANNIPLKDPLLPQPIPQPNPMQQKVEAEIQKGQAELQMKQQGQQAELAMKQQEHQVELAAIQAKANAEAQSAGMHMQVEQARAQQEMALGAQKAQQEVTLGKLDMLSQLAQRQQEAKIGMAEMAAGIQMKEAEHRQGLAHRERESRMKAKEARNKPNPGEGK